jgi:hypothetical protein
MAMHNRSIRARILSVLLMLIFFQQMGAGLFVHNLFHGKERAEQLTTSKAIDNKDINIACSCVDNFLMPFLDAAIAVSLSPFQLHIKPVDSFSERTYFTSLIFSSLRGPPVV